MSPASPQRGRRAPSFVGDINGVTVTHGRVHSRPMLTWGMMKKHERDKSAVDSAVSGHAAAGTATAAI